MNERRRPGRRGRRPFHRRRPFDPNGEPSPYRDTAPEGQTEATADAELGEAEPDGARDDDPGSADPGTSDPSPPSSESSSDGGDAPSGSGGDVGVPPQRRDFPNRQDGNRQDGNRQDGAFHDGLPWLLRCFVDFRA